MSDPFEALEAYQSGEMSDADAAGFEEELFAAAAVGAAGEAAFVDRVAQIGRYLLPRGGFDFGSPRSRIDELRARGLKVQLIDPELGPVVELLPIEPDVDIVVTRFRVDARGYDSLDCVASRPDGRVIKTFRDVSCDPEDGSMYALCEAPLARLMGLVPTVVMRLVGTRDGVQHTIAQAEVSQPR